MKEAILVIDMLDIFVHGRYGSENAKSVVEPTRKLIDAARRANKPVYYLCDAHKPGDRELELWGEHAMDGSEEAQIIQELAPKEGDIVIKKQIYSGFRGTNLDSDLKKKGIDTLIYSGVATHICVNDNLADGYYNGFDLVLAKDAIQSFQENYHTSGMEFMEQKYTKDIRTVDDIIASW